MKKGALARSASDAAPGPMRSVTRVAARKGQAILGARVLAEETAVAFTYDFTTHAVMMATPMDLEDFAVGFSFTEGVIGRPDEMLDLEISTSALGVDVRVNLAPLRREAFHARRRHMVGPAGCGLCGLESLSEARRPLPVVAAEPRFTADDVAGALDALTLAQAVNAETHAVHAAGFWSPSEGLVALREDVGRHNALDKLAGCLVRRPDYPPVMGLGLLLLTSRISIELVQKAAILGAPVVVAVSAPTALAVAAAQEANITLVGVARQDGFEVFTHARRIAL